MPQLVRLAPGQVTVLPGTQHMLWAKFGAVDVKLYADTWFVDAPDAYDGQPLALVVDADHVGWVPMVAQDGRGSPPHPGRTHPR